MGYFLMFPVSGSWIIDGIGYAAFVAALLVLGALDRQAAKEVKA